MTREEKTALIQTLNEKLDKVNHLFSTLDTAFYDYQEDKLQRGISNLMEVVRGEITDYETRLEVANYATVEESEPSTNPYPWTI